mmetsp:Transcript_32075/g.57431  ORF Transcript_32075/g.57431 Transcript_32075/m.57431 type:complete len:281 (-) Transcript_32075:671-1513(-)
MPVGEIPMGDGRPVMARHAHVWRPLRWHPAVILGIAVACSQLIAVAIAEVQVPEVGPMRYSGLLQADHEALALGVHSMVSPIIIQRHVPERFVQPLVGRQLIPVEIRKLTPGGEAKSEKYSSLADRMLEDDRENQRGLYKPFVECSRNATAQAILRYRQRAVAYSGNSLGTGTSLIKHKACLGFGAACHHSSINTGQTGPLFANRSTDHLCIARGSDQALVGHVRLCAVHSVAEHKAVKILKHCVFHVGHLNDRWSLDLLLPLLPFLVLLQADAHSLGWL